MAVVRQFFGTPGTYRVGFSAVQLPANMEAFCAGAGCGGSGVPIGGGAFNSQGGGGGAVSVNRAITPVANMAFTVVAGEHGLGGTPGVAGSAGGYSSVSVGNTILVKAFGADGVIGASADGGVGDSFFSGGNGGSGGANPLNSGGGGGGASVLTNGAAATNPNNGGAGVAGPSGRGGRGASNISIEGATSGLQGGTTEATFAGGGGGGGSYPGVGDSLAGNGGDGSVMLVYNSPVAGAGGLYRFESLSVISNVVAGGL